MDEQQRYLSYLLRLWQTSDGGEQIWRASVESSGTGERRGFANLEGLFEFLQAQTESQNKKTRAIFPKGKTDEEGFR